MQQRCPAPHTPLPAAAELLSEDWAIWLPGSEVLPGPAPGAIGGLGGLLTQNSGGGLSLFSSDFTSNSSSNSTNATAAAPVATLNRTFAGAQTGVQVMHCRCL